jgi:hypothetical protein
MRPIWPILLIAALAGCATAPKYHPVMICVQVGPGILTCADAEELKAKSGALFDEPLQPRPQSAPVNPRSGA